MRSFAVDGLVERRPTAAGMRFVLRDEADIERRVRDLVALKAECCGFLDFDISRDEGRLALDVSGVSEARPVIAHFFAPGFP